MFRFGSNACTGHMYGNIGQVSCLMSTLMGGVSGSAVADASMECRILGPEMNRLGYDRGWSAAINGLSGLIVATIPPSMGLIIYGTVGEVSIGRLFMAGWVPGILMCVLLMLAVTWSARRFGYKPEHDHPAPSPVHTPCWSALCSTFHRFCRNAGWEQFAEEGMSHLRGTDVTLKSVLESDVEGYLGKGAEQPTLGVLTKLIDSAERLTLQVHPDKPTVLRLPQSQYATFPSGRSKRLGCPDGGLPAVRQRHLCAGGLRKFECKRPQPAVTGNRPALCPCGNGKIYTVCGDSAEGPAFLWREAERI